MIKKRIFFLQINDANDERNQKSRSFVRRENCDFVRDFAR